MNPYEPPPLTPVDEQTIDATTGPATENWLPAFAWWFAFAGWLFVLGLIFLMMFA
ncbi:hypothetical protein SH528x_004966 [Novipirellula sp. SH528]|uniref:hypothetical protein n=1 Tax=Novipirellula sp. SH528 TaxID=3454466 RepID=UPI003F9EEC60